MVLQAMPKHWFHPNDECTSLLLWFLGKEIILKTEEIETKVFLMKYEALSI